MATELGKAYVQIVPSAEGIKGSITKVLGGESAEAGTKSGESIGTSLVGKLKGIIAAAGIGAAVKTALDAGGALQQSFGGLDTLYEEASGAAKKYAAEAASAGISANTYAEQAVSFGAALKQSFKGDVVKAAEAANQAILDMADNSAKMGTDIGSIQNAYQGFAKGNFTMLDNLKLGYGGTKEEMQRLIDTANKLNLQKGIISNYSIDSFGDIAAAIHVVQDDLKIAGVAAGEAETTFTGSFGAMRAAAENLMANMTLGEDVKPALTQLVKSTGDFLFGNLIPMVGNLVMAIPGVVSGLMTEAIPQMMTWIPSMFAFLKGDTISRWLSAGTEMISNLASGFFSNLPTMLDTISQVLTEGVEYIIKNASLFLDSGMQLLSNIATGFMNNYPQIMQAVGNMLANVISLIGQNLPQFMQKGVEFIGQMAQGLINNLPTILSGIADVLARVIAAIASNLPKFLQKGIELIGKIAAGIIQAIPTVVGKIPQVISGIVNAFGKYNWGSIGTNLIKGIAKGVTSAAGLIKDAALSAARKAFNAVKGFFGIASPSKLMANEVGKYIPAGIAMGIEKNTKPITDAMHDITDMTETAFGMNSSAFGTGYNAYAPAYAGAAGTTINVYGAEGQSTREIAYQVADIINSDVRRKGSVWS
jgi:phage-related protein|nr:MAG TPA: tail tape measure protein [Caudoviricetes sp.]